ncbi:MAG TPA: BrnA antitoxin family protein [Longimicrobiaceae bacterium]|nr:BrnA antitoxin family protein [Longimicrobiaceae bacterium]
MRDEYDIRGGKRGALDPLPPGKSRITIRLDDDVLDWFRDQVDRAGGGNYQTLMNAALREHIAREREPLEATLRRVLREELAAVAVRPEETPKPTVRPKARQTKIAADRAANPRK